MNWPEMGIGVETSTRKARMVLWCSEANTPAMMPLLMRVRLLLMRSSSFLNLTPMRQYVYPPYWHEFREASSDCVTAWDNPCSGETIWLLWLGWVSWPKQELRSDIDPLSNLLMQVEAFNILQETGNAPAFERENLQQNLGIMGICKRHRQ